MQSNKHPVLVVTPEPCKEESIIGYILRASERNGYDNSADLLRLSGVTIPSTKPCFFDVEKISPLFGMQAEAVKSIAFVPKNKCNKKINLSRPRNIYVIGHKVRQRKTIQMYSQICPQCISETGYISSCWSIVLYVGCPRHKRLLVDECTSCKQRLRPHRRGVLKCVCGADLSKARGRNIKNDKLLSILEIIRSKLTGESIVSEKTRKWGYPISYFQYLSMDSLLTIIYRIAKITKDARLGLRQGNRKNNVHTPLELLETAADVFSDWPNGFNKMIGQIEQTLNTRAPRIEDKFPMLYDFLFKSSLPKHELVFLRNAFISYENSIGKTVLIDSRLAKRIDEEMHIVGVTALSAEIGIHPSTIHKLLKSGVIEACGELLNNRNRYAFDITNIHTKKASKESRMSEREAARYIGLPVSVLRELRERGIYKVTQLGDKVSSYTLKDTDSLVELLGQNIENMKPRQYISNKHILLVEVMKMKLGGVDNKTKFVEQFMDRGILPIGIIDRDISKIVFNRVEVLKYIKTTLKLKSGFVYVSDAAKMIKFDSAALAMLIVDGYLETYPCKKGVLITRDSLGKFSEAYVSCAWIAERLKTTTRKIVNMCSAKSIRLMHATRSSCDSPQPFIRRKNLNNFGIKKLPIFYKE